jgi:lactoylglutathione lyase
MATAVGQYCISVTDLERSVRFYKDIAGLKVQTRTQIPNVNEVVLAADVGGGRLQLAQHLDRTGPVDHGDALWKIYMNVDNCAEVHQRALDGASSRPWPPSASPAGRSQLRSSSIPTATPSS